MDYPVSLFVHSATDIIPFERHFNIATFFRSIYRNSRLNLFTFFFTRDLLDSEFRIPHDFFDWGDDSSHRTKIHDTYKARGQFN